MHHYQSPSSFSDSMEAGGMGIPAPVHFRNSRASVGVWDKAVPQDCQHPHWFSRLHEKRHWFCIRLRLISAKHLRDDADSCVRCKFVNRIRLATNKTRANLICIVGLANGDIFYCRRHPALLLRGHSMGPEEDGLVRTDYARNRGNRVACFLRLHLHWICIPILTWLPI